MKVKVAVRNECSNNCTNALQCPQDVIIREGCGEKNPEKSVIFCQNPLGPPTPSKKYTLFTSGETLFRYIGG